MVCSAALGGPQEGGAAHARPAMGQFVIGSNTAARQERHNTTQVQQSIAVHTVCVVCGGALGTLTSCKQPFVNRPDAHSRTIPQHAAEWLCTASRHKLCAALCKLCSVEHSLRNKCDQFSGHVLALLGLAGRKTNVLHISGRCSAHESRSRMRAEHCCACADMGTPATALEQDTIDVMFLRCRATANPSHVCNHTPAMRI